MELSERHFQKISRIVYESCGINLKEGKEALVRARLLKRLRSLRLGGFSEYIALLEGEGGAAELPALLDVITTNKTGFFREADHFIFIRDEILPSLRSHRIRFWSAACSSGEEPYSLAMVLRDAMKDLDRRDVRILATDISSRMIEHAKMGLYSREAMRDVPPQYASRFFIRTGSGNEALLSVSHEIRSLVTFSRLNLMENWPMKGPFDVILCRNVMIYFDRPTQERLVNRFWDILRPEGYLFVGHSEGLTGVSHRFRHVRPAIYRK
jgi:chemotaxis protein methyltransferase CheR